MQTQKPSERICGELNYSRASVTYLQLQIVLRLHLKVGPAEEEEEGQERGREGERKRLDHRGENTE